MSSSPDQQPEQILLVDDDPNLRIDWSLILEDAGYLVLDAENADKALAILERDPQRIDVLYTDIDMPGSIDGLTLAQQVHKRWPHVRLVVTRDVRNSQTPTFRMMESSCRNLVSR